jgi:hypothetical protein
MRWLTTIAREIFGLFVDDGSFALAIVIWLMLVVVLLPRAVASASWASPVLFAGLAIILAQSVLHYARKRRK